MLLFPQSGEGVPSSKRFIGLRENSETANLLGFYFLGTTLITASADLLGSALLVTTR